jgi:hypothetical protein
MTSQALPTYLNDHLAGAVAAVELLDYLIELHRGSDRRTFYETVQAEIIEDQKELQGLVSRIGGRESQVRKAAAWLSEKLGQAKLALDDRAGGQLRTFEALEALALGIQGKQLLWKALEQTARVNPALHGVDFVRLQERAQDQYQRVDQERLQVARRALET